MPEAAALCAISDRQFARAISEHAVVCPESGDLGDVGQLGLLESPGPARGASFAAWSRLSLVVELLACGAILYHVLYVRSF